MAEETDGNTSSLFMTLCQKYLTADLAELFKAQHYLTHNGRHKRRLAFKILCLNLYFASPRSYRVLENIINLPKSKTLRKLNIPISTGINEDLINILKIRVDHMTEADKECCVVVGVMPLRPNLYYDISNDRIFGLHDVNGEQVPKPAKHAVVIIVRGILTSWMQPLGYAFLSQCKRNTYKTKKKDDFTVWIDDVLDKLFNIGLKVRAFVADQATDFLYKTNQVRADTPYFIFNSHTVNYIYDVPQLMTFFRNSLMTFHMHFANKTAKYEDILKFYEEEKGKSHKFSPNLTDSHVKPSGLEKHDPRYAVELLSRSVALGISKYVDFKVIDESARGTVHLVQMMNDLFDMLNSSTLDSAYQFKKAYSGQHYQVAFLTKMFDFFKYLEFVNPKHGNVMKNDKLIEGFPITIRSIQLVFGTLKLGGHKHLCTRHLNQEIVNEFFAKIRSESESENPTCREFVAAFRKLCFKRVLQTSKKGKEGKDVSRFLLRLTDFLNLDPGFSKKRNFPLHDIKRADYNKLVIPKENPLIYVSGWLLSKCVSQHKHCDSLKVYLDVNSNFCGQKSNTRFSKYREYITKMKSDLPAATPDDFVAYVEQIEKVFVEEFENKHKSFTVGAAIFERMLKMDYISPAICHCFPKEYLLKLFVRMRIFTILKFNSVPFRSVDSKKLRYIGPKYLVAKT